MVINRDKKYLHNLRCSLFVKNVYLNHDTSTGPYPFTLKNFVNMRDLRSFHNVGYESSSLTPDKGVSPS